MRLAAIDLSLTKSGFARIEADGSVFTQMVKSTAPAEDVISMQLERMETIVDEIVGLTLDHGVEAIALEGPSLYSKFGRVHQRGGLWWLLVKRVVEEGYPIYSIPPSSLKLYTTGLGSAGKDVMVAAVARRFPSVSLPTNDVVDAVALLAMLARHLGNPIDGDMPKKNLSALDKVDWTPA
jgi:Holliday junction resolvasome RuvABC endonuclease subunit